MAGRAKLGGPAGWLAGLLAMLLAALAAAGCGSVTYGSTDNNFGGESGAPGGVEPSASASTTSLVASAGGGEAEQEEQQLHVVARGETLISIAAAYSISLNDLVRVNNIADPRLIYVGQRLIIPPPPDEAARVARTIAPPTNPVLPSVLPTLAPSTTRPYWER